MEDDTDDDSLDSRESKSNSVTQSSSAGEFASAAVVYNSEGSAKEPEEKNFFHWLWPS